MELPHGVLVRSFNGPIPLVELNTALLKDSFTGFMRASLFKGTIVEGIIIYSTGKPIIAFTSDAKTDRPDNEQKAITSVAANEDSVIELFALNEGQLRLAMDFSRDFLIKLPPPPPPPPPPKPVVEAPRPMPVQRPKVEKPLSFPEVRGTFTKSESYGSLRSYIETRRDETGHAMLIGQDGAGYAECHLLFLKGKVMAAYSASAKEAGASLLNNILPMGGVVEFYHVDEAIVHSILKMYPHVAVSFEKSPEPVKVSIVEPIKEPVKIEPRPMQVLRPEPIARAESAAHGPATRPPGNVPEASKPPEKPRPMETHRYDMIPRQGIGVPAKSLFEKSDRPHSNEGMGMPAPESKSTGTLKGDMDDDADFVKKVEKEFVGNVDDLLKRLELSHLKVVPDKKKRL
jgi:hypothetical protein